eukprot:5181217-Prymnesium_polylepis.2
MSGLAQSFCTSADARLASGRRTSTRWRPVSPSRAPGCSEAQPSFWMTPGHWRRRSGCRKTR